MLAHERLDVYRCSIEFLALSARVVPGIPRGNAMLADQLKRAALSVPLNSAEGAGEPTNPERRRFYGMARGSAMECGAVLDACRVLGFVEGQVLESGKALRVRIVSMLTRMCK
jgi:four helix bundle protein